MENFTSEKILFFQEYVKKKKIAGNAEISLAYTDYSFGWDDAMKYINNTKYKLFGGENGSTRENLKTRSCLEELYALVKGECPSLLDEDRGGNSRLALAIDEALRGP